MAYGDDARARGQIGYQQQRVQNQQGPLADFTAYNYGRGAERNYGDYGNLMGQWQNAAMNPNSITASHVGYTDPFNSYGGFNEFSQTGGYSPADIANMRARGVSPIRGAYANAQREIGRQRSLQGGYAPNAIATQARMAREQGQSMAGATTNVEAQLAEARNRGRLSGLQGMAGIEGQRLGAQLDAGKFNAQANMLASQLNMGQQMDALRGMNQLYGTSPGMASTFGNQALQALNTGAQFGLGTMGNQINAGQLPGNTEQILDRIGQVGRIGAGASGAMYPWLG